MKTKPCPFCGSTEIHVEIESFYHRVRARCDDCDSAGMDVRRTSYGNRITKEDMTLAIDTWNRRCNECSDADRKE